MIVVNVDLSGLRGLENFSDELTKAAKEAVRDLSAMSHAKAVELSGERLHTRRQMYLDALSLQEHDGVWLLSLAGQAAWIDNGMEPHSMLDALLASPKAKRAADGSKFIVVPFEHGPGKGATNTAPAQLPIVEAVKAAMKQRGIPWAKVERDQNGRPIFGRLHRFNVAAPEKTGAGAAQGWGPVGDVRQGYSERNARMRQHGGPGGGGAPFLQGVAVYQHADAGSKTGARRSVMTFRIASSKHQGQGRWEHPGLEPTHILDDVAAWAVEEAEKTIIPALVKKVLERT